MSTDSRPIAVLEYGMGNVFSVRSAFLRLGCNAVITDDAAALRGARAIVIPGVGAFGQAMENLRCRDLVQVLRDEVLGHGKPTLGICLGMQLFADSSEEMGHHEGLGWIPGRVTRIKAESLSLPHVGWNNVQHTDPSEIFARLPSGTHFYFDHTYEYVCTKEHVIATVEYGTTIAAAVRRGQIMGVQFHPEKSQTSGLKLLRGFLNSLPAAGEGSRADLEGARC
jgi:glutamine amidotransferase